MVDIPAVQLQNVSKSYGKIAALKSIDLNIQPGKIVAIFGHNGAGKSTLLRIISMALNPDIGDLQIMGADATKYKSWCRSQIGYVGHVNYLYPDLSPSENLMFFAQLYGVPDYKVRVFNLLEDLELTSKAMQPLRNLSNGEQKRTSIGRALVHQPSILLMDEPDAGLDVRAQELMRSFIKEISANGGTVLFSSHEPNSSLDFASEFLFLSKGNLITHSTNVVSSKNELFSLLNKAGS